MKYALMSLLLLSLSFSTLSKVIFPNTTLRSVEVKKRILNNLKSDYKLLFSNDRNNKGLKYQIERLVIDNYSKQATEMRVIVSNKIPLAINCQLDLVKLITKDWMVTKSACKSTKIEAGLYYYGYEGLENLLEERYSFDEGTICYQGKIKEAVQIANAYKEDILDVGDEHKVDIFTIQDDRILLHLFDMFSYESDNATEEGRPDYVQSYSIERCE